MEFYLRVEGVNLANFIYDTMDLSTTRGGGLLLLEAINQIQAEFEPKEHFGFQAISTGASSGLFSFNATGLETAKELQQQVAKFLNNDKRFKHATFVIDTLPVEQNFTEDKEKLLALNRWQQLQSPSVVFPATNDEHEQKFERPICSIDHIRPVAKKGPENEMISESVYQRRDYGRKEKQQFYKRQTRIDNLPKFVNDLDQLSTDEKRGNLHHKLAVIYLDGNGFGKIQHKICQGANGKKALQNFDTQIKAYRHEFIHDLLNDSINQPQWTYGHKHRLETLLWGGDEIILVVPAWLGWWTLDYFFTKSKDWKFGDDQLTHAAGLVFCHHNAPIHQITDLAKKLGDLAKDKKDAQGKKIGRQANYVAYQVLESFDYAGNDLKEFRNQQCGDSGLKSDNLILPGNEMAQALVAMDPIKRAIPKGRVYAIVQAIIHAPTEAEQLIKETESQLDVTAPVAFEKLRCCFGRGKAFWVHLIELWDYIDLWNSVK